MSSVVMPEVRLGTAMFLIAPGAQELASWGTMPTAKRRRERQIRAAISRETFSQKEERHEYHTRIKDGLVHFHRQMDTQDFDSANSQALSPWAVVPPARERVAAYADQNSPQSRNLSCGTCPSRRARCASRTDNHTTIDKDMNIDNKTILTTGRRPRHRSGPGREDPEERPAACMPARQPPRTN